MNRLLALLAFLAALPAQAEFRYTESSLQLVFPGAASSLTVPREDWRVAQEQRNAEGSALYYYVLSDRGLQFSVYIDRTTECNSAESCRALWRSKPHPSMQGAKTLQEGERNGFSFIVYQGDARVGERTVPMTNVSAHAYRDGHWVDFRASASGATAPDPAPLLALVDKIAFAAPVSGGPRRYPAGARLVELDVPPEWTEEPGPGRTQTVRFARKGSKDFMVLVSFAVPPEGKAAPGTPDRTQANVRRAADAARERSVERTIDVVALKGEAAQGYYFKATDRVPEKGGFRHIIQGEVRSQQVAVTFTILSNDGQESEAQRALEVMRGLRLR
jgi:hypothetical protein